MPAERRLAAIMFTDIVGYTALMARDEEAGRRARTRHEEVVRPLVERYHGQWIERTGDETLSSFPSALDAVNCALAVQAELDGDADLRLRIGLHQGDVTFDTDGVSGDGVNVAARVRPLAEPGGVCVSDEVQHSLRGRTDLEFVSLGEQDLKNVGRPLGVYAVGRPGTLAARPAARSRARPQRLYAAVALAAVLLVSASWWLWPRRVSEPGPIRSIAVLPLDNLSGDPEQDYLSDGMTEALIASLVRASPELRVISRTSVMQYQDSRKTVPEIAGELGVTGVIEGSAVREGDRVRVTVQLVDGRNDVHVWAESFEREFESALELQGDVAREVAKKIRLALLPDRTDRLADSRPVESGALESYMRGMQHLHKLTVRDAEEAIALFERAAREDPEFARAHAYVARAYFALAVQLGVMPWSDAAPKMAAASERALALDDSQASAWVVLARVRLSRDWDWDAAGASYARALDLEPSNTFVQHDYSNFLVSSGRAEEGLALGRRAVETAPLDLDALQNLCWLHYLARRYDEALAQCGQIIAEHPEYPKPHLYVSLVHRALGDGDAAYASLVRTLEVGGYPAEIVEAAARGFTEASGAGASRALGRWQAAHGRLADAAWNFAAAGDHERALSLIQEMPLNTAELSYIPLVPEFDPVRADPRFRDLLRRINYPGAS
jgi:TolB-like protein/class 3 adenylate cyclase/Tfp pilus assembly protein PilF